MKPSVENHDALPWFSGDNTNDSEVSVHDVASCAISEITKFCQGCDISTHSFVLATDSLCIGFGDFRRGHAELDNASLKVLHSTISTQWPVMQLLNDFQDMESELPLNGQGKTHPPTAVVLLQGLMNPLELPWFTKLDYNTVLAVSFNDAMDMPDKISFVYRSTRLPLFYVEHISSNFVHAMNQVMAHPHRLVNEIEIFSPLNQSAITQWNKKEHQPVPLLEVVRGHAKSRPDHAAICAADGTVSYAELEWLTTRWASYLQTQGVRPECLVPVMMHHSKWAVIAELAILKAGGVFVPLDPAQPLARLENIMQQCKARIAVSCDKHVETLSSLVDTVVPISEGTTTGLPAVCLSHLSLVTSERTAYVLFTSGSTGRPKGCVVSYEALSDVVRQTPALKIAPDSRVLQFASYTYGMSLIEIYCTLAAGATICIPSDHERLNVLSRVIRSMETTWAILTPSTTMSITESAECLKTLVVAGEALTLDHVHALADKVEVIQAFGLTEWGGICCVSQPMSSNSDRRVIGRAPTARLWLVDPNDSNKLAPVGAVAELLVQGPALADGYLGQPEKTAAVFLKDPLWLPPWATGSRLYRTGDLVQYTSNDGNLRYVSRKDTQVKIRGMRVELAEVEYQIRQAYSQLDQAIVEAAAPKDSNDILVLVAFVYPKKKEDLAGQTFLNMLEIIRGFLVLTLPDYMRPSVYIPLDSVPLTISRKVDRKALRQTILTSTRKELERHQTVSALMISPQTDLQRLILELVAEVLRLEPLSFGLGHNFVSLGGDSVTAMLLVNKLRKHGYGVTVGPLLGAQTLSDIPSLVQTRIRVVSDARQKTLSVDAHLMVHAEANGYRTIPKLAHDGPIEQSFSQARIWFLQEMHADSTWLLLPSATRIRGTLQLEALNAALSTVVKRQEALRTTFTSRNGVGLQVVAPFQPTSLKVVDMTSSSNDELMSRLYQQQNTPMDLTKECCRVTLFRLSATDHVLSIVLHHIIADGWSFDIFVKSLAKYYNAIVQGRSPQEVDTPLPIQYRDFTVWQRQEKTSVHEEQLAYWERQLAGSHPLEFLCDKHRPAILSGKAGWQPMKVDGSLYRDLRRFCRSHQVTPFSVLLAAFRAMHFRLTGVGDATVGIPAAARTQAELEGLIGYFGNVQCIRTMVESRDQSFRQLVDQVQSATTAAFENQDVPFDRIVSRLVKDRDVSRHPLVQVTFVLHPQTDFGRVRLDGLQMEQLHLPQVSRLDLEFHLYPGDDFLRGDILYSEDLFHAATIQGMLSVFDDVLREGLRQPNADVGSLPLTDGYDTLNRHGLIYPEPKAPSPLFSIISIFLQQVALHPEEIAVRDIKTQLTYSELDETSSILASWLARRYSLPLETPIGVYAPRSCEGIVAYFGIMKAGLAYVPLDVDAPMERIETILSCLSTCQLVLMGSDQTAPVVSAPSVKFAYIAQTLGDTAAANMPVCLRTGPICGPTSLACILFTSGTTGQPKGVMMEQYGIVRLAKDPEIVAHIAASKVSSYLLNPVFDASGFDIYPALLNGGTLVCVERQAVWDYTVLEEVFVKNGVRRAVMTPAMLSQCLFYAPGLVKALDILYVGGDKLDPADVAKARRCGGRKLQIFNCYGPTENSIISTRYAVPEDEVGANGIPIGRAIVESGAYVMDRNLRLVPIGVLGELVVTGLGLARGYLDLEHNRNRFVTINIGNRSVPAYRTGDLVRYRPDDMQLEFFGRMDQQVKIRGHRVEPAEIDNVLLGDDLVTMALTVLQKRDAQTGGELVSFVTVQESAQDIARLDAQIQNSHIDAWRERADADDHYGGVDTIEPETLGRDFLGWVSMYNGQPIGEAEMTEWLNDTVAAIHRLEPRRVLEIGTGTGMVLFNLIGSLEQYFGLEPSSQAVRFVQNAAGWVEGAVKKVNVQVGTAADIAAMKGAGPLDLAIINSVVQYFPSITYLRSVILDLINTQDVKCIFFGDIRSYALHREFQASKVLHLYGHTLTGPEFRERMAEVAGSEQELLVDPAFFTALAAELPDLIEHVEIMPKRMKVTNELSCYRYVAILYVKQPGQPPLHVRKVDRSLWIDFEMQGLNAQSLAQLLKLPENPSILAVSNIPYKKTIEERFLIDVLQNSAPGTSGAGWSQEACKQAHACPALAAADLVDLALQTGWEVEISWARQGSQHGGLDAIFYRSAAAQGNGRLLFRFPTDPQQSSSQNVSSNNPLKLRRNCLIESQLLERLRAKLPSYLVPQLVRVLDRIPVNNVGKVDRKSLEQRNDISAPPAGTTTSGSASRQAASWFTNEAQRSLWEEFTGMLGVEVGIDDSFFDLGGHSLMAIKLISRINKRLGSSLRVSELFQYPTVARLGSRLQVMGGSPPNILVSYTPFSLALEPSYLDKVRLPSGATVVDIFPVTECQAWFLRDWSLVSHTFIIHGDLDVARFRSACQKTVQKHAVLRTVFTTLQGNLVQVICESVDAPFVQKTTGHASELGFTIDNERGALTPTALTTRFTLVSHLGTKEHQFILQLCHAQYDGPTLFALLSDIASTYRTSSSSPLGSSFPFSHYLHASRACCAEESFGFWRNYLAGSSGLTAVPPSSQTVLTNSHPAIDTVQEVAGALPPLPSDVTLPTLVNAAIAVSLAALTQSNDITFVCVMSSRDVLATASTIESHQADLLLGPCINRILLRVEVPGPTTGSSALDFCRRLRDNQAHVSGKGHLGLKDIVENCTNWRLPSTDSGTDQLLEDTPFVLHLPADTATPSFSLTADLDVAWKSTDVSIRPRNQVIVRSTASTTTDNELTARIQVQASCALLSAEDAAAFAVRILGTMRLLSTTPEAPIQHMIQSDKL
ncbi:hypothetical protein BJY01DRAFT_261440 [Aspergillus pseudoustus]|uniref:Carrier domain-containing protein n=1 Tax=Aspergillus pseudoustus TaxID=1810923 RepID=A0ABR4KEJ2_9EURO